MINIENLEKLKKSLVENENDWQENLEMMTTAFKESYGFFSKASLRDLGLIEEYKGYLNAEKILKDKMSFEIKEAINKLALTIKAYDINVELFDYRLPFELCSPSQSDYNTEIIKPTTLSQVQMYFMEFDNEIDLNSRHKAILKEFFFFNHLDVTLTKGKFHYEYLINDTKRNFRALILFDKSGEITIIGKIIKQGYKHHYEENPQGTNDFGKFKYGIDISELEHFFFEFIKLNDSQKNKILIELDGIENLQKNLFIVNQLFSELKNLKR